MIELRYLHIGGSDHRILQYRYNTSPLGLWKEWSKWKFVPGIVVSQEEFEEIQKESSE